MDNLEKFIPENFTEETVKEINAMSYEELQKLEEIPGLFLIRDKASDKAFTGQSTFRNLATLHRLGFANKYEVVGVRKDTQKDAPEPEQNIDTSDFISPERSIVLTGDNSLAENKEGSEANAQKEREYQLKEYELLYGEPADESLSTGEIAALNRTKENELNGFSEENTGEELNTEDQADEETKIQESDQPIQKPEVPAEEIPAETKIQEPAAAKGRKTTK